MTVRFFGEIDGTAEFADLKERLGPRLVFHLGEVRRVDGRGTLAWVRFVRDLEGHALAWTHCSPAIVGRLNVVSDFAGGAELRSILAPYACAACGRAEEHLLDVRTQLAGKPLGYAPAFPCDACGQPLELDDLPERYFSFLHP